MGVTKIKDNIYWVGVRDKDLRVFDIVMETKRGTTYNSYLINDEKVAIVETVKNQFSEEFIENIKSVIGNKSVDYIIVNHTELDHSGSLKNLIEMYKDVKIVASKAAINYLKDILNIEFNYIIAGDELSLGKNTLQFISAPNLHWPDTMFTYMKEEQILFTCDVMGCHYCPDSCITDECSGDYYEEMKYYFDVIMGPFKRFVNMALNKIEDLPMNIIAPSHGPLHVNDIEKYIKLYREWAKELEIKDKNIQIFYISAYGNTESMANYMKDSFIKRGIMAETHEITSCTEEELITLVDNSSGILIGSPTINQEAVRPAMSLLSLICPVINKGKVAAAFGSYGWSGEGVPMITEQLKQLKFKVVDPGYRFKFVPDDKKFEEAEELVDKIVSLC